MLKTRPSKQCCVRRECSSGVGGPVQHEQLDADLPVRGVEPIKLADDASRTFLNTVPPARRAKPINFATATPRVPSRWAARPVLGWEERFFARIAQPQRGIDRCSQLARHNYSWECEHNPLLWSFFEAGSRNETHRLVVDRGVTGNSESNFNLSHEE